MPYQQCPYMKGVKTPDTYSDRTGIETKGDYHGVCSEDGMECPGHCERWSPPPPVTCEVCGAKGEGELCDSCSDKQARQSAWEDRHPLPGSYAYRRRRLQRWAEDA